MIERGVRKLPESFLWRRVGASLGLGCIAKIKRI